MSFAVEVCWSRVEKSPRPTVHNAYPMQMLSLYSPVRARSWLGVRRVSECASREELPGSPGGEDADGDEY